MLEQHTTRLGSSIHAFAVVASHPQARVFHCFAPYAQLFAGGPLTVLADPRATRWSGRFAGPVNGEHVRDVMARAAGVSTLAVVRLMAQMPVLHSGHIVLCPHAAEQFKEWPEDRWAALAEALLATGHSVLVLPDPAREPMRWPRGIDVRLVGVSGLAGHLASAALMIGPDSGHVHLADALGTPAVGLYAATSAVTYGPYSNVGLCIDRHRDVFPAGRPYDTTRHIHGSPMDAIDVASVLDHLARIARRANIKRP